MLAGPAREPAPGPAPPADAVPASTVLQDDMDAQILLQDGTWDWTEVTGQQQNARGR